MKTVLISLVLAASALAQSIVPSISPASVVAGKSGTLTLTFTPGTTAAAGTQWSITPPAGVTISGWSAGAAATSANKSLTCGGTATIICVVVGLNTTAIPSGVIATATVTVASSTRGSVSDTVAATLSADPSANALSTNGGSATLAALSPFDLNGDGLVNQTDLTIVIQQLVGTAPCTTGDLNGDGICNVKDALLMILDALSPTP